MIERSRLLMLAAPLSIPLMLATLWGGRPLFGENSIFVAGVILGVGIGLAALGIKIRRSRMVPELSGVQASPGALAEHWGRFRNRAALASVLLFLATQAFIYTKSWSHPNAGSYDIFGFYGALWAIWSIALTLFLATGGALFKAHAVRRLMNDDISTANRQAGRSFGFYVMIIAALLVYGLRLVAPLTLDDAVHGVVTAGLSAAMLRYAWLERQADRAS